jgi:hypothetical protein
MRVHQVGIGESGAIPLLDELKSPVGVVTDRDIAAGGKGRRT